MKKIILFHHVVFQELSVTPDKKIFDNMDLSARISDLLLPVFYVTSFIQTNFSSCAFVFVIRVEMIVCHQKYHKLMEKGFPKRLTGNRSKWLRVKNMNALYISRAGVGTHSVLGALPSMLRYCATVVACFGSISLLKKSW